MVEGKPGIEVSGPASRLVIGSGLITQSFYDRTGRNWNKHLMLAHDLGLDWFMLGDPVATTFSYVLSPVQTCIGYVRRVTHDEIADAVS